MIREFMRSREVKEFLSSIKSQYGAVPSFFETAVFLISGREKIYLITRSVDQFPLDQINLNSAGLYIAELKNGQIRLSIEGAQLIGPFASKNICEVQENKAKDWLQGKDIEVEGSFDGFVIIKQGNDFLGSGKFKDGVVFNYVPKTRRIFDVH